MKILLVACFLLSGFTSTFGFCNAMQDLQKRLANVNSFYATFKQTVISSDGIVYEQGLGELWIKRPYLFNWHLISPDESILISDGKTLWFYNPCLKQVIATWLHNAIDKMPFMLLASNNPNDWNQYQIKQNGDEFELIPKASDDNLKKFVMTVNNNGTIRSFTAVEQDQKRIAYILKIQKDISFDINQFIFIPPSDVQLDDQRQSSNSK